MNKPLTIEELKALQAGDWVWVVDTEIGFPTDAFAIKGQYRRIDGTSHDNIYFDGIVYSNRLWDTYGKTWLAYKNKEQAECKGEIVELRDDNQGN